ncbi:MAG TPA: Ku protein [Sandaracinaceae bacterium]
MAARAIWKGTIGFGLVQIPVELVSAESKSGGLTFTMLDQRNMGRVGYERVNKETGEPVPWEEVVKGYEIDEGEFVVLNESDFARANVEATQTIDIVQFVAADEVDWIYCEKPYYLRPTKRGLKAYALLRDTLRETGKVGIAKVVVRARQHVAVVLPRGEALMLEILRFPEEIRSEEEVDLPEARPDALAISPLERDMARQLVEGMTRPLDLSQFTDEYRRDLLRLIEEKAARGEVNVVRPPEPVERAATPEVDLMSMLKQSLQARRPAQATEKATEKRTEKTVRREGTKKKKVETAAKRRKTA